MKTPNQDNFKLVKLKLITNGGLDCKFKVDDETDTDTYNLESPKDVHPDLARLINGLKPVVARVYGMNSFRVLLQEKAFAADTNQATMGEQAYQYNLQKIDVTGLAISGDADKIGIVITATFLADTNQKMAINTHLIKLKGTKYGFEEDLEVAIDDIKEEVYKFLFENKHAQLSLFGDDVFDGKMAAAGVDGEEIEEED